MVISITLLAFPQTAQAFSDALPPHAKIKSVAIISAIGETFMFEHVRNAPFEWMGPPDASFFEISDWGIDDLITRQATAVLARRYKVVPVQYVEADFDTWTWYNLVRHIRELPPPDEDVDAYIAILRDWRSDEIGSSVHQVAGLGLYRRDYSGQSPRLGIFASYRILIVDARTYDVIASRPALTANGMLPWLPIASSLWPRTQNDMTKAQKVVLQSDTQRLVEETLAPTLDNLFPPMLPLPSRSLRSFDTSPARGGGNR